MPANHTVIVNVAQGGSATQGSSASTTAVPMILNWEQGRSGANDLSTVLMNTISVNSLSALSSPNSYSVCPVDSVYDHVRQYGPESANMLVSYTYTNTSMSYIRENQFLPCNYIAHTSTSYEIGFGEHVGAYMTGKSSTDDAEACNQGMIYAYSTGRCDLQYDVNYMYLS